MRCLLLRLLSLVCWLRATVYYIFLRYCLRCRLLQLVQYNFLNEHDPELDMFLNEYFLGVSTACLLDALPPFMSGVLGGGILEQLSSIGCSVRLEEFSFPLTVIPFV